ncbi:MAG TPA: signal peptidase I [Acidimicrobiales bacterium]
MATGATVMVVIAAVVAFGPLTGRYRTTVVLSGSMAPELVPGDLLVLTPKPTADLDVGDVIVYRPPTSTTASVTHRVVEIYQPGNEPVIRTKGDANGAADPWVARLSGNTVWEVHDVVPGVGSWMLRLASPWSRRALTILAPLVLAAYWLRQIWRTDPQTAVCGSP